MSAAEHLERLISSVEADLGIDANAPIMNDTNQTQQTPTTQQTAPKAHPKCVKPAKTSTLSTVEASKNIQPEITKLDIRVGHITNVWKHETADKLYCEGPIRIGGGAG